MADRRLRPPGDDAEPQRTNLLGSAHGPPTAQCPRPADRDRRAPARPRLARPVRRARCLPAAGRRARPSRHVVAPRTRRVRPPDAAWSRDPSLRPRAPARRDPRPARPARLDRHRRVRARAARRPGRPAHDRAGGHLPRRLAPATQERDRAAPHPAEPVGRRRRLPVRSGRRRDRAGVADAEVVRRRRAARLGPPPRQAHRRRRPHRA